MTQLSCPRSGDQADPAHSRWIIGARIESYMCHRNARVMMMCPNVWRDQMRDMSGSLSVVVCIWEIMNCFFFFCTIDTNRRHNLPSVVCRRRVDSVLRGLDSRVSDPVHPGPLSLSGPWRGSPTLHIQRQTHSSLSMTFLRKVHGVPLSISSFIILKKKPTNEKPAQRSQIPLFSISKHTHTHIYIYLYIKVKIIKHRNKKKL